MNEKYILVSFTTFINENSVRHEFFKCKVIKQVTCIHAIVP